MKKDNNNNFNNLFEQKDKKALGFMIWAIIATIMAVLLLIQNTIIASYPKSQGYVIEVSPDGSYDYDSDAISLLEEWKPKDATVNYFLRNFIIELRSVSSDIQINTQNINKLYRQVQGLAYQKVNDYIKENDPKKRYKKETVEIAVASIIPLSDSTYQIDFRETVWEQGRRLTSDQHYRCVVHTDFYTPNTIEQKTYNPIGLFVTDYEIVLVKEI